MNSDPSLFLPHCVSVDLEVDPRTARVFAFAAVHGGGGEALAHKNGSLVTTAKWDLTDDELAAQPWAGSLLALDVGVADLPETRFAG